jgi:O-antigen/teichoic acid export membrane protein
MIYLSAHAVTFIISLLLTILFPYYLGVEEYANYAIIISIINFLIPIATLGTIPFIIRNYKNQSNRAFDLSWVTKRLFFSGCVMSTGILIVVIQFSRVELQLIQIFAIILAVISSAALTVASGFYRASGDGWSYFTAIGVQKVALILIICACFYYSSDLNNVNGYFIALLSSTILSILIVKFNIFPKNENKQKNIQSYVIGVKYCLPIAFSNLLVMAIPLIERVIITTDLTSVALAQYVFNFDISTKLSAVILIVLKVIVWPKIVVGDATEETIRYKKVLKYGVLIVVIYLVAIVFLSSYGYNGLMKWIFPSKPLANINIFLLSLIYSSLIIISYLVNMGLLLTGKTKIMLFSCLVTLLLHLLGMMVLIPTYGVIGAALSICFAQFFNIIISYLLNLKYIKRHKNNVEH